VTRPRRPSRNFGSSTARPSTANTPEVAKLDDQKKEYEKFVQDKIALNVWYATELNKIRIKERVSLGRHPRDGRVGVTRSGEEKLDRPEYVGEWGIESQRAKSYAQDIQTRQKIAEDFEANNRELWKKSVVAGRRLLTS
jgi:hypothetical protein